MLVGLHQFPDLASAEPSNERRIGLDHSCWIIAGQGASAPTGMTAIPS
jgi:hypothetical protein